MFVYSYNFTSYHTCYPTCPWFCFYVSNDFSVQRGTTGLYGNFILVIGIFMQVKGTDYKTHDGTCIRDYIDVTDLVDAHVKALKKAKPGEVGIYNVGTGRGRSVKEFVEACKKATGVEIKVDYLPRRPGDYAEVCSDPTKIRRELNWTAQFTDLRESLRIAWRWQKAHRDGYAVAS